MTWLVIAVVAFVLLFAVMIAAKKSGKEVGNHSRPYIKRDVLLTPAERSFLGVLEQAVGGQYRVYAQVRLADLLAVEPGISRSARATAQNRINGKHADFVLCDKESLEIICAIELDDVSHQRAHRQKRDSFVEEACRAAGLPLARFAAKASYSIRDVQEAIQQVVVIKPEAVPDCKAAETPQPVAQAPQVAQVAQVPQSSSSETSRDDAPACPKCGGQTLLRVVKAGAHAGKRLWGCSNFPACRGYIPIVK